MSKVLVGAAAAILAGVLIAAGGSFATVATANAAPAARQAASETGEFSAARRAYRHPRVYRRYPRYYARPYYYSRPYYYDYGPYYYRPYYYAPPAVAPFPFLGFGLYW